jgi:UDP-N-acetylglucosamine--N-acetylmuramyl-(pentapeptide) pyrophosphoryl-undecaprenol N-acetylglucosamine transferase
MVFISEKEIDAVASSKHSDFRLEKLPSIGLPSPFSPAILGFVRRFNESLSLCRGIYRKFKPHLVLGMGGFTSAAPVLAARFRGIPTFIHESNAVPGRANRMIARMVRAVLLGFKECAPFFPTVRTEVTGTPIRTDLKRIDRAIALEKLGLRTDRKTLLVMGGSQGASGINRAIIKSISAFKELPLQVIHLSGTRDEQLVADNYRRENVTAYVAAFHHHMEEPYSAADLAIARSGAATLAELASFSLPSIFIPYPFATDNHQMRNAEIFAHAEAAIILKESELSGDLLVRKIRELIDDSNKLRRMSDHSSRLAPKDAADLVVKAMEKYTDHDAHS